MSSAQNKSHPGTPRQFFFLLTLFFSVTSTSSSTDLQILLQLKSSLNSNSPVFDTWQSTTSPCSFTGIICNSDNSVIGIDLPERHLTGTLPFDTICQLQSLQKLNLGSNSLVGTVSDGLKNCTKLTYLDLSLNSFTGSLPEFSTLSSLEFLNLNYSGFSGKFPWKSIENLTSLQFLSVGDNPLFETSSFPVEILKLSKLYWLYLTNCSIEGRIPPEIGNLSELSHLELSNNGLVGSIPVEITKLHKLKVLEMYDNDLTGKIPVGLGNLTNLQFLDVSVNNLEGDISEVKSLSNLISFQCFDNNLSGEIPAEFGDFKFLVNFSIYGNMFTGTLPAKLGSWAEMDFIDVSENQLTGPIPPDMCKKGKMTALLMLQNKFTGVIPESYGNCSSMTRFRVSNNSLSGNVPAGIWGLPNLDFLDLDMNQFDGAIGPEIGNAKSLTQLHLKSNRFSGDLPSEISKASALKVIDLGFNQFSGPIASIGDLKMLNSIYLQENMFHGSIPESISSCSYLNNINFAGNLFSGRIPASLGSLPSLNSLNLSNNQLSNHIPSSLSSPKLSLLDLSNNRLSGPIPKSLSIDVYNGSFAGNPDLCTSGTDRRYFRPCSSGSGKSFQIRTLVTCFLVGLAVLLLLLGTFLFIKTRAQDRDSSFKSDSWNVKSFSILSFDEQDILNAVKQDNLIGTGGSGNVYKVELGDGKDFAVKHIWKLDDNKKTNRSSAAMLMKRSGNLPEFDAEVETLSSIRHVNVVKLYCSITSEDSSLLVYEYLPNGSLWDRLHTSNKKMKLDWETRYDIAVGAAKGLEYLHHGCDRPVLHRDVKSSNILLDEFFKPRIADFGLAKIVLQAAAVGEKGSTGHIITGTHGYIAPEYAYTYKVNEKSDVYSFGVVLMELVTGRKPIESEYGGNKDIVQWICSKMTSRESVIGVVDSNIPEASKEDAIKVLRVAVVCTAQLPALRPSMRKVVQMLEDAEPCKLIGITIAKDKCAEEGMETKY